MNPRKKYIRQVRLLDSQAPWSLRKKLRLSFYLYVRYEDEVKRELYLRSRSLKLNKGFYKNGESKLLAKIYKRQSKLLPENRRQMLTRLKQIDKIMKEVFDK